MLFRLLFQLLLRLLFRLLLRLLLFRSPFRLLFRLLLKAMFLLLVVSFYILLNCGQLHTAHRYAEAVAAVAAAGGRRRASDRVAGSKGRRAGGTAALEERLHALYMGENVIPLPLLRASSAAALALEPYPEPPEEAAWLQVLADVALESYSGAPGGKPDRANAVPPAALQQVRVWVARTTDHLANTGS